MFIRMKMDFLKKGVLVLLLPLLAFTTVHKFYVSVTNINYVQEEDTFQITTRIFIDDLQKVLQERYDLNLQLATKSESDKADAYIEKYVRAKFVIKINGKVVPYTYLGKKYDTDLAVCYLELPKVNFSNIETIEVQNEILMDLFEEQQNIVHIKLEGKKKSFILIRENNKGMLNL